MKYTARIQVGSCDEALLDVSFHHTTPEDLAKVAELLPRFTTSSSTTLI